MLSCLVLFVLLEAVNPVSTVTSLPTSHSAESVGKAGLMSNLQGHPHAQGRGTFKHSGPTLLLSMQVGHPAGGARSLRLAPLGSAGQFWPGPLGSPFPRLGRVPVKLWLITRSLSPLPLIFVLSVPPPPVW